MEHRVTSGTAHDANGTRFAVVGISNVPTDWARVFSSLAESELTIDPAQGGFSALLAAPSPAGPVQPPTEPAQPAQPARPTEPAGPGGPAELGGASHPLGPRSLSTTPPSVLNLNAYLLYALGKAARRRLTEKLSAHGLRLWHLTVMAMVADLGPQMKTVLAARLDMNASDLVKIVNDLVKTGHVDCGRDPADRRRVVVRLTPAGRAFLGALNAEIASTDDEVLAPLSTEERELLGSLLRRVHRHLEPAPAGVVHEQPRYETPARTGSVEDGRIDWTRPAEEIARLVEDRRHLFPTAYTHHDGRRLELLGARVSEGTYSGAPGLVIHREDEGVVIVTGPKAATGAERGLVLGRLRTEAGREVAAEEYFPSPGALLADRP
ncbi:winged helix DNA-binding protein [Streptomyces sp. NPDC014870]|uniref:winged helix DNA-binding protein n=1 Tax=Streptomyces sp. NPDC014870 TaxID=3364925 RepID=UPI003701C021